MSDAIENLKSLHTALVDSREGYKEALADANDNSVTPLLHALIGMRETHHRELDVLLRNLGAMPDESGSFMSTVHRTVIKVRSLVTGINESILPGLIDGEKRIVGYYDDAIGAGVAFEQADVLRAQRDAVTTKIAEMEAMKQAART